MHHVQDQQVNQGQAGKAYGFVSHRISPDMNTHDGISDNLIGYKAE
jgi:hypothetical protein